MLNLKSNLANKKRIILSFILAVLIAVAVSLSIVFTLHEENLQQIQDEALQELAYREGEYDEQRIVLQNTSLSQAKTYVEKFDAKLRITSDGSFAVLTLPDGVTIKDIYEDKKNRQDISKFSVDYYAKTNEVVEEYVPQFSRPNYTVSDELYSNQSYLDYLNLGSVWNNTKGTGIDVAIIDTGIDTDHPEFAGKISEYSYNATEDKIVKDYTAEGGGYDWSLIEDEQGHGTSVAGVVAAQMDGKGTVGIAPDVNIIVISRKESTYTKRVDY